MNNREWMKSLSDRALAEEIKYGRWEAESGRYRQPARRNLRDAEEERASRPTKGDDHGG